MLFCAFEATSYLILAFQLTETKCSLRCPNLSGIPTLQCVTRGTFEQVVINRMVIETCV